MIIAIIPAKNNSRRLKKKNMVNVLGKPMIYHTIKYAKKSKSLDKIVVSSESKKIINFAKKNNLITIKDRQDFVAKLQ